MSSDATELPAADLQPAILQTTLKEISERAPTCDGEADCCVICLGEITEPCESRPCQHAHFDYLCLLTWLGQRKTCPLCKVPVTSVRHNFSPSREEWNTYYVTDAPVVVPQPPHIERRSFRSSFGDSQGRRRASRRFEQPSVRQQPSPRARTQKPSDSLDRRRYVYRHRLFSLHVGSSRPSLHRDLSPESFSNDTDLVSRARMFLRRELQVFEFLSPDNATEAPEPEASGSSARPSTTSAMPDAGFLYEPPSRGNTAGHTRQSTGNAPTHTSARARTQRRMANAEFVLEYIISILKTVDMQGSMGQAEALIIPFLGRDHTQLLLHELRAWLRSPYLSLANWDRNVQYLRATKSRHPRQTSPPAIGEDSSEDIYPSTWRRGDPL